MNCLYRKTLIGIYTPTDKFPKCLQTFSYQLQCFLKKKKKEIKITREQIDRQVESTGYCQIGVYLSFWM